MLSHYTTATALITMVALASSFIVPGGPNAFTSPALGMSTSRRVGPPHLLRQVLFMSDSDGDNTNGEAADEGSPKITSDTPEFVSFSDASAAILQEEEEARMKERGGGLSDEDRLAFEARKDDIEAMRKRIQDRAKELGVEKSGTTLDAIKDTQEAAAAQGRR